MITDIINILSRHTTFPRENMNESSMLVADLELNSYDVISIITEFEDAFDIEIPDKDIKKLQTIGDIASYIENKLTIRL